jgi:hypothetical protein
VDFIGRTTFGNTPDTSKALRLLVGSDKKVQRTGRGGRIDPFQYQARIQLCAAVCLLQVRSHSHARWCCHAGVAHDLLVRKRTLVPVRTRTGHNRAQPAMALQIRPAVLRQISAAPPSKAGDRGLGSETAGRVPAAVGGAPAPASPVAVVPSLAATLLLPPGSMLSPGMKQASRALAVPGPPKASWVADAAGPAQDAAGRKLSETTARSAAALHRACDKGRKKPVRHHSVSTQVNFRDGGHLACQSEAHCPREEVL